MPNQAKYSNYEDGIQNPFKVLGGSNGSCMYTYYLHLGIPLNKLVWYLTTMVQIYNNAIEKIHPASFDYLLWHQDRPKCLYSVFSWLWLDSLLFSVEADHSLLGGKFIAKKQKMFYQISNALINVVGATMILFIMGQSHALLGSNNTFHRSHSLNL